jgi:hypothetical protein
MTERLKLLRSNLEFLLEYSLIRFNLAILALNCYFKENKRINIILTLTNIILGYNE